MKKTYRGSCHCGAVRFESVLDLGPPGQRSQPEHEGIWWTSTFRCNCSYCTKTRFWKAFATAQNVAIVAGEDALSDYRFGEGSVHHLFCRHCGVHPFGRAELDFMGGAFYAINIACLDDATDSELAQAPLAYEDGRHDRHDRSPSETRHL